MHAEAQSKIFYGLVGTSDLYHFLFSEFHATYTFTASVASRLTLSMIVIVSYVAMATQGDVILYVQPVTIMSLRPIAGCGTAAALA